MLTWIGVTLLPLGLVVGAGRAFLAPSAEGENPAEMLQRALVAGFGLLVYDWAWGVAVRLVAAGDGRAAGVAVGRGRRRADA